MYGLVRILFAAAITFFTAAGAFTGGTARPLTRIALPGGAVGLSTSGVVEETPPGVSASAAAAKVVANANTASKAMEMQRAGVFPAAPGAFVIHSSFVGRRG